ncbi:predicted protein [Plenodomus lingam JN3]|uniref:Predicted protein n=1 Tax=Leptosphaeria maculans (strain JN3 / isolate v23.1.3 / race Av1-4-5-6-7-8) TaxID=985895 RepID=E4ZNC4_LEPMJ|nr:predicted protein [Plenodomus lingam JN3]CBX92983.1 predicted protein [Plenodomus lingam JN3]
MDVDKRCRTVIRSCLSDESEVEIDKPMGSKRVALWCTYRVSAASSIVTCVMAREGGPVHTNGHIPHALLNASPPLSSLSSVVNGKGNTPDPVWDGRRLQVPRQPLSTPMLSLLQPDPAPHPAHLLCIAATLVLPVTSTVRFVNLGSHANERTNERKKERKKERKLGYVMHSQETDQSTTLLATEQRCDSVVTPRGGRSSFVLSSGRVQLVIAMATIFFQVLR